MIDCLSWLTVCHDWLFVLIDCLSWLTVCPDWLFVLTDCLSWLTVCGGCVLERLQMPVKNTNRFLLLYGSQTGQAQAISEEIAEKAEREGLHAETHCLSLTEQKVGTA